MREVEQVAGDARATESLEHLRRVVSWICISVFAASFVALLGLSATTYWAPGNFWLIFLDRVWRTSGLLALCLWAIPHLARFARWLGGIFGF